MPRGRPFYAKNASSKTTTNDSLPLDVRALSRRGLLARGAGGTSRWWYGSDKERGSSISFVSDGQAVTLLFSCRGESVKQRLLLVWTPCNFGGRRVWFSCPQCARRVAVVYYAGSVFACRHCCGLGYGCQKESPADRTLRRVGRLRARLGDPHGNVGDFIEKPKGMHWETFLSVREKLVEAEAQCWGDLIALAEKPL
jgi:hypothetical protein